MQTSAPRLSIVVPVYCEAEHIANSLSVIRAHAAEIGQAFELIVVDDGSTDDTWQILEGLTLQYSELRAVRLARNFGKEGCLFAGLTASKGDAVIVMDSDLQHPPKLMAEMYRLWTEEGYDVVNAVKIERGDETWLKRHLTRFYYTLFGRLAGVQIGDSSDFKLLSRSVVDIYCQLPERNTFFRGLITWMGFKQTNIPFKVAERAGGKTRWSFLKLTNLAIGSMVSFTTIPLQVVTLLGAGFMIFALALGAQSLWLKLSGEAIEGFTTVILLLLIIGAVLMIALGIIGQYLAKIFDEVKGRPRYLIRERSETSVMPFGLVGDKDQTGRRSPESKRVV